MDKKNQGKIQEIENYKREHGKYKIAGKKPQKVQHREKNN